MAILTNGELGTKRARHRCVWHATSRYSLSPNDILHTPCTMPGWRVAHISLRLGNVGDGSWLRALHLLISLNDPTIAKRRQLWATRLYRSSARAPSVRRFEDEYPALLKGAGASFALDNVLGWGCRRSRGLEGFIWPAPRADAHGSHKSRPLGSAQGHCVRAG